MSSCHAHSLIVAVALTFLANIAIAAPPLVDGRLDPDYGAPIVTQTTQTGTDDTVGAYDTSSGQELDAAYGLVQGGVLYLMLTGNMWLEPNPSDPGTFSFPCHIFLDTTPGGQDTVRALPHLPMTVADFTFAKVMGLRFDAGFSADYWVGCFGGGGPDFTQPYNLQVSFAVLPTTATDTVSLLGFASPVNSGTLSGGANPHGIQIALDNSNLGGVAANCGAAGSGAGATTGIELAIPLAAIGNPSGPIRVCAFLTSEWTGDVSNQVLGPVPPGSCSLGASNTVDFSTIPGPQYFVVDPAGAGVPAPPPTALALAAAPSRGAGLTVRLSLPAAEAAELDVMDASGRRVCARSISGQPGPQTVTLAAPGMLPAGVYFMRLAQGARAVTARAVVIP